MEGTCWKYGFQVASANFSLRSLLQEDKPGACIVATPQRSLVARRKGTFGQVLVELLVATLELIEVLLQQCRTTCCVGRP